MVTGVATRRHRVPRLPAPLNARRGQALVELALVTPILLLVLTATAQFGSILATQVGIANAVREAAREAATVPTTTSDAATAYGTWTRTRLVDDLLPAAPGFDAARLVVGQTATRVCYLPATGAAGATEVHVEVHADYRHAIWLPFIGGLLDGIDGAQDGALRVGADTEMRVENAPGAALGAEVCVP